MAERIERIDRKSLHVVLYDLGIIPGGRIGTEAVAVMRAHPTEAVQWLINVTEGRLARGVDEYPDKLPAVPGVQQEVLDGWGHDPSSLAGRFLLRLDDYGMGRAVCGELNQVVRTALDLNPEDHPAVIEAVIEKGDPVMLVPLFAGLKVQPPVAK